MKRRFVYLAWAACFIAGCGGKERPVDTVRASASPAGTAPVAAIPMSDWKTTPRGFGPLEAGMSPVQAYAAMHLTSPPRDTAWARCAYATLGGLPAGVRVMVENGTIARIDVDSAVITQEGARVGDSEERLKQLYGDRLEIAPHKYTDGHYLIVRPVALVDSAFRLVFETDGRVVRKYRAGRRPPVEYVEGCS